MAMHDATASRIGAMRESNLEAAGIEPIRAAALRAWLDPATGSGRRIIPGICKRTLDVGASALAIAVLTPLMLILLLLTAAATGGHPIFVQQRVGRYGAPFRLFKFRTMAIDADRRLQVQLGRDQQMAEEWARFRKLRNDPRVTRVGRVLRRYSLDELPQFLNVLVGHMSLVGPRPIVTPEMTRFGDRLSAVLSVRPGLTGLWSVSGRNDVDYDERVRLEHRYATRWTLGLDMTILLKTVPAVVRGRGAY
jgi:exopolysaccharide production protein ExoY